MAERAARPSRRASAASLSPEIDLRVREVVIVLERDVAV
jgi:hypothetical protein